MKIIIPTYDRQKQLTYSFLSKQARQQTIFCCNERDQRRLSFYGDVVCWIHPPEIDTIAKKRAYILREAHSRGIEKLCMFDDDLRFATRKEADWSKTALRPSTPEDVDVALAWLEQHLDLVDRFVHAGFGPRQGNNNTKEEVAQTAKMMYALGFHVPTVLKEVQLNRVPFREDYDITLQLLRKGFDNVVYHRTVVDNVYDLPGGCHDERTVERSDAAAELLAELHPGLVKVVEKDYKGSVKRKEVVVSWKKSLGAG